MWVFVEEAWRECRFGQWRVLITCQKGDWVESFFLYFNDIEPTPDALQGKVDEFLLLHNTEENP